MMTYAITENKQVRFVKADSLDHASKLAGKGLCTIEHIDVYNDKAGCNSGLSKLSNMLSI